MDNLEYKIKFFRVSKAQNKGVNYDLYNNPKTGWMGT
jgi:hypothetical protein